MTRAQIVFLVTLVSRSELPESPLPPCSLLMMAAVLAPHEWVPSVDISQCVRSQEHMASVCIRLRR